MMHQSKDCDANNVDGTNLHKVYDSNNLYKSFRSAIKTSKWKTQSKKFEKYYLFELAKLKREIKNRTYVSTPKTVFPISERGKTRIIHGSDTRTKTVKHCLCDYELTPNLEHHLIYDNGASQKCKGVGFTRRRLVAHLSKYYRRYHTNEGYILIIDFSKYYDNIIHEKAIEDMFKYVSDDYARWLTRNTFKEFEVDVSYMNDDEYSRCMNEKFDSIAYNDIPKKLKIEKRFMRKSVDIGDQISQICGIYYPHRIDNYIKNVLGEKYYGRCMDDSYIISNSKQHLEDILLLIRKQTDAYGISINEKKTRICSLKNFKFLQTRYSLSKSGRIYRRINRKRLVSMRKKLKKLSLLTDINKYDVYLMYYAWIKSYKNTMTHYQRRNMDRLFISLFGSDFNKEKKVKHRKDELWKITLDIASMIGADNIIAPK